VRAYGENVAKHCKEEHPVASVFFRRLCDGREQKEKHRLVPSLADQLAESPYAPEEPKIEIPGAFYVEPDIPEHNPTIQFEKLITRPLQNVRGLLPPNSPVVSVLDSVHNIDCDTVGEVIGDLAQAVNNLHAGGVNAKAVVTGVDRIVNTFAGMQTMNTHTAPISSNPSSSLSMARSAAFPFLNGKYGLPELVQRGVEITSVMGTFIGLPPLISVISMTLLQSPLKATVGIFGPLFLVLGLAVAMLVGVVMVAYKELGRFI
jgi:hypothetical protein